MGNTFSPSEPAGTVAPVTVADVDTAGIAKAAQETVESCARVGMTISYLDAFKVELLSAVAKLIRNRREAEIGNASDGDAKEEEGATGWHC